MAADDDDDDDEVKSVAGHTNTDWMRVPSAWFALVGNARFQHCRGKKSTG